MQFLAGNEIATHIKQAIESATKCDLAVAFWGEAGPATLGILQSKATFRIICDARSGACNPIALSILIQMPNVQIRTIDKLHSKVYLTEAVGIVGSANASANGLGDEDYEAANIEAAAGFTEQNCITDTQRWFDEKWNSAEIINASTIQEIEIIWRNRQKNITYNKKTFINELINN